ncbi:MAG: AAA family ATPase [Desulfovibrionaceae bacterium]|jgi:DNA repair protein RecN (Recombination protein N)|nr:AAA family ATPase [Desulfovibrionaceae bacterium]
MLELLRIRNLALIEDMELEFAPGLNVLSGETGAGKSFILKALGFLTGDRLETGLVRPGEDKARAEAIFVLDGESGAAEDVILRRELAADTGRSRLYVNDSLGSQETVKALKPSLIIHTSQHGQQELLRPAHQAAVLDAFLPDAALVARRDELVRALRALDEKLEEFDATCRSLEEKRELLEYQLSEIEKVDPRPGEEDELEERKRQLREHQAARDAVSEALTLLRGQEGGLLDGLGRLSRNLETLARAVPDYADEAAAAEETRQRLMELEGRLIRQDAPGAEDNLEAIESRLWELAQLARKLRRPLESIVTLRNEIQENLSFLDSCNLDRKQLRKQRANVLADLGAALEALNRARHAAAESFTTALAAELAGLGFDAAVRVEVQFSPVELAEGLIEERPRFLWVPNPGQPPQPLDKIASGGELSRFLLALVSLLARAEAPTLIFDEVDAGVGGITLTRVGERLKDLSRRQQVILITHWPQLAALADRHFHVRKQVLDGQTTTTCQRLSEAEIAEELSRMAGGGAQGAALARELLG